MAEEKATATAAAPSPKIAQILDLVGGLTLLEASELVKAFEQKFGVSAAPVAMAMAGAAAGPAAAAPKEEEQTSFTVVLKEVGAQKIQVIKAVRAVTTLGLKEAKALVDGAPGTIKEGATKEEAAKIKDEVEKSGGKVEIK
jgi:large subunit ribosomal protein L7/L12